MLKYLSCFKLSSIEEDNVPMTSSSREALLSIPSCIGMDADSRTVSNMYDQDRGIERISRTSSAFFSACGSEDEHGVHSGDLGQDDDVVAIQISSSEAVTRSTQVSVSNMGRHAIVKKSISLLRQHRACRASGVRFGHSGTPRIVCRY